MGFWLGSPTQRSDRSSRRHNHAWVSLLCSAESSSRHAWRSVRWPVGQVTRRQSKRPGPHRSVCGGRKACRKDFYRFTGHHNLNGSCLQLDEARDRYRVVYYATSDQYGRATTSCWSLCAVAEIIGKLVGLFGIKKCLSYETFRHSVGQENAPARAFCLAHFQRSTRRGEVFCHVPFPLGVLPYSATKTVT